MGKSEILRLILLVPICLGFGCKKEQPATPVIHPMTVVATVYPLAHIARQIGGSYVKASWIVEIGQSLSGVEVGADLRTRLQSADMVISNGITEPWASQAFDDPMQRQRILRLDLLPAAQNISSDGYLWLDPVVVKDYVRELSSRLIVRYPEAEKDFRSRADQFNANLDALINEYQPKLARAQTKKLEVLGPDFSPLLRRFGFEAITEVQDLPTQLSDSELKRLKKSAQQNNARVLLVPADTPSVVMRDLEVRAGLHVVPIDALGSSAAAGHDTYLELLKYDLDQLLGATTIQ